jgi:hypothetical protein
MFNALMDYARYRMKRGRYASKFIEASGGRLATVENFPPGEFPKPGQFIISHTPDSFMSWLVMYFTDSIWSHIAAAVDHGEIVETTLEGTIVHPFRDILNGSDYLLVYTPPHLSAEQERALSEAARSLVGVTKYGYPAAAIIFLRLSAGRDINYRPRLSADFLTVLLLLCWLGRRRKLILVCGSVLGLLYTAMVLLHAKYRRNMRASHLDNMTSRDAAVRALARFPGIRGRAVDGIISMRGRRNRSIGGLPMVSPVFEQAADDRADYSTPDETTAEMESYLRQRLRSKGKRDPLRIIIEAAWKPKANALPLRTVGKWTLLTSTMSPPDAAEVGSVLQGADGINALGKLEAHVDMLKLEVAARHSSSAWFLMLRRASNCVRIGLPQASSEVLGLAATAAQSSTKSESYWRLLSVPWMPTPKILSDIDDLLSLSILKRNIQVAMRRVTKGQAVRLGDAFAGIPVDHDVELERAIELYDQRTGAASAFLEAEWLGIAGRTMPISRDSRSQDGSVTTWRDLRRVGVVPRQLVDKLLEEFDPYHPWATNVEAHMKVLGPRDGTFKRETLAIEVILSAAQETLSDKGMLHRAAEGTWSAYGYIVVRRHSFLSKISRLLEEKVHDEASAAQLWVMVWAGSVRILYPAGKGRIMIDLEAASDWLPTALTQGTLETLSNERSTEVKRQIQEIVDSSPWRPADEFRHLIGRMLNAGSESVMAVDAVAMCRDTLILINVNTAQDGKTFMSGGMEAVRSLRTEVEGVSKDWDEVVEEVCAAPAMLDLKPEAFNIDGVVVMPFVPFVHLGTATRLVEGLRHVASIEELILRVHSG